MISKFLTFLALSIFANYSYAGSAVAELHKELAQFEGSYGENVAEETGTNPCPQDQLSLFSPEQITNKMAVLMAYCEEHNDNICTDFQSILPEIKAIDEIFNKENDPIYMSYTFYLLSKLAEFGKEQRRDIDKELINAILESLKEGYGLQIPDETYIILAQIDKISVQKQSNPFIENHGQSQIVLHATPATDIELAQLKYSDPTCYEIRKKGHMCIDLASILSKAGIKQDPEKLQLNRLIIEDSASISFQNKDTAHLSRSYESGYYSFRAEQILRRDPEKYIDRYVKDRLRTQNLNDRIVNFMDDLGLKTQLSETRHIQRERVNNYLRQITESSTGTLDIEVDGKRVSNNPLYVRHEVQYYNTTPTINTEVELTEHIHISPLFFEFSGAKIDFDHEGTNRSAKFDEGFILPGLTLKEEHHRHNDIVANSDTLDEEEKDKHKIPAGQMFVEIEVETFVADFEVELPL